MTSKRSICPSHNRPLDVAIWWNGGRRAWVCDRCAVGKPWTRIDPEFERLFNQILDEIFGKDPRGKKPVRMKDREFAALLDRISAELRQ